MLRLKFLLKLKVLSLIYLNKLNLFDLKYMVKYTYFFNNYFCIYINGYNFFFNNNITQLVNNKLLNVRFNQFYLYKKFLYKLSHKKNFNFSNYNINFLFLFLKFFNTSNNSNMSKKFLLNQYNNNNLFFFKFFILKFLGYYFKDKSIFLNIRKNQFEFADINYFYILIYNKSKRLLFLKSININLKSFIKLLLVSLISKDVILLKNFVKYILESIHFKKHKSFLYSLKTIFLIISVSMFNSLNIKGLYIKLKGKIGVGGNLKKRKYNLKLGEFSFTKKNQKLNYVKDSIRTYSGVLGFEIYLSYF